MAGHLLVLSRHKCAFSLSSPELQVVCRQACRLRARGHSVLYSPLGALENRKRTGPPTALLVPPGAQAPRGLLGQGLSLRCSPTASRPFVLGEFGAGQTYPPPPSLPVTLHLTRAMAHKKILYTEASWLQPAGYKREQDNVVAQTACDQRRCSEEP